MGRIQLERKSAQETSMESSQRVEPRSQKGASESGPIESYEPSKIKNVDLTAGL